MLYDVAFIGPHPGHSRRQERLWAIPRGHLTSRRFQSTDRG